jgi:hypothetical protein
MKGLLRLEELIQFLISMALLTAFEADWWWYPILFLGPDISMIGYVFNTKIGAFLYNLFHYKGTGLILAAIGVYLQSDPVTLAAISIFGHACMDRSVGYGLKYFDSFNHTHLGMIGKTEKNEV